MFKSKIYQAIRKAADQIEAHPERFKINAIVIPEKGGACGSPGCALGWISHYYGVNPIKGYYRGLIRAMRIDDDNEFYERMAQLVGIHIPANKTICSWSDLGEWTRDAAECARLLRLYAEKYHTRSGLTSRAAHS